MTRLIARRRGGTASDAGVYAILYAVLVVVLLGMAAIVVDFAQVRSDRRLGRSATDSAALGGAAFLNGQAVGGGSPYAACQAAWKYLALTLQVTTPAGACGSFASYNTAAALSTCTSSGTQPNEIDDDRTIGNRTFRVAWPIPRSGGNATGFLNPDIAPGNVTQSYAPGVDGPTTGNDWGCDRLGVAMFENTKFALGNVLGSSGTSTQVHSVARFNPNGGPNKGVAALNVLDVNGCESMVKTGNGYIYVWPTVNKGVVVGPGTISVESSGSGCNGGKAVIAVKGGTGQICAMLSNTTACDGGGIIQDFASGNSFAYNAGSGTINPTPVAEAAQQHWDPITSIYGCHAADFAGSPLPSGTWTCATPTAHNYIDDLITAYGGAGTPVRYTSSQPPYVDPYTSAFVSRSDICSVSGVVVLTAGNWFANCSGDMSITGTLIVQGGNLVATHGINVTGCFIMNTAVNTCNTATTGSGAGITTAIPPASDAVIFLRAGGFTTSTGGTVVMPQTFVYAQKSGGGPLQFQSTTQPLWTAPGAGALNGSGRTTLEQACYDSLANAVNQDCLASRFSRLAYWSDFPAPQSPASQANTFNGQGQLAYVGVFFTPLAYDNLTGGSGGQAAAAQFWAYDLNINGGSTLELRPDARFAVQKNVGAVTLIR